MNLESKLLVLIIIVGVIFAILFLWEVPIIGNIYPIFLFIVMLFVFGFVVYRKGDDGNKDEIKTSLQAIEYAQSKWKEQFKEDIQVILSTVRDGYVPNKDGAKKFYGMLLSKGGAQRVAVVVRCSPPDVLWQESPPFAVEDNPFLLLGGERVYAVPNPIITTDDDHYGRRSGPVITQYLPGSTVSDDDKFRKKS